MDKSREPAPSGMVRTAQPGEETKAIVATDPRPDSQSLHRQGIRFLFTGMLNTAVGYSLYLAGLAIGLLPELALAVATTLGAIFNYFSTGRMVFGYRALDKLPRFIGSYALIYCLNAAALRGVIAVGIAPAIAQALLLPVVVVVSFLIFRTFVFSHARAS